MRYQELFLPLAGGELRISFHPRLTVLAGLSGQQRRAMIDAFAAATAGTMHGARVSMIDSNGRQSLIGDVPPGTPTDSGSLHSPSRLQNLLAVYASDLGLPTPSDDPGKLALQTELVLARHQAATLRQRQREVEHQRETRTTLLDELEGVEATLAEMGSAIDRYTHRRARTLVELEKVRATLDAVDASPTQLSRDASLIEATLEIQHLADQWAEVSERLDVLRTQAGNQRRIDTERVADLVDVPETVPATLTQAVQRHDQLLAQRDALKAELAAALATPRVATPSDTRILALATMDQETLWMTHRNVVLATDALRAAEGEEAHLALQDPAEREYVEQTRADLDGAVEDAEHKWLRGILTATICVCVAGILVITNLYLWAIPALLVATVVSLAIFVARPKLALRRARHEHDAALRAVGAENLSEYLHRFRDDPESKRWQRAEQLIEDYEGALAEWHDLVGHISPADATMLEPRVADWIAANDPEHESNSGSAIRRKLERTKADLSAASGDLRPLLEPFGLIVGSEPVGIALDLRISEGRSARLQVTLDDAAETEAKLTRRLESQLGSLGFESGNLGTRIHAFGRELDAARQREKTRASAPAHDELVEQVTRLEAVLAEPAPTFDDQHSDGTDPGGITELRRRRDEIKAHLDEIVIDDDPDLARNLDKIENHIASVESTLSTEESLLVDRPVDQLVETLIQHRPSWPTCEHEIAPALLDDPFAALDGDLKQRLLHALTEVSNATQIILLTDDAQVHDWARNHPEPDQLTLVAPGS